MKSILIVLAILSVALSGCMSLGQLSKAGLLPVPDTAWKKKSKEVDKKERVSAGREPEDLRAVR